MSTREEHRDALDAATSQRLARLGERPIDTSAIEQRLNAALAPPVARMTVRPRRWWSPLAGAAASLFIAVGIYLAVSSGGGEAQAAIVELSQLHQAIVSGQTPLTPVESIEQANDWIAEQTANGPQLPDGFGNVRVQSCCLAEVQGDLVAVAVMRVDGRLITLVVADAPGFAHEMGTVIEIDGRRFFGHELNSTRMMMASIGNRWICVMGDAEYESLAWIASGAKF